MIEYAPSRFGASSMHAAAIVSPARSLLWLGALGVLACTKDTSTLAHSKSESAQLAPANLEKASVSATARPVCTAHDDAPRHDKPATPPALRPPATDALPIELFAPFNQRFAGGTVDPFQGEKFHVRFDPGQPWLDVSSCDVLLGLPIAGQPRLYLEPSTEDELRAFWYVAVDCLALSLVRAAKTAQQSHMAPLLASKDPSRLMPPQLGMVDFDDEREDAKAAAAQCRSWKEYDRDVRLARKGPARFAIRGEDWSGELLFYARGDIDGDGNEDVLVRRDGGVEGGSYGASALFVLSRTEHDSCIRVVRELGSS
ncbi:MAG: hypothetical protein RLZZ450_6266 [Pseudomonadota bacterium]